MILGVDKVVLKDYLVYVRGQGTILSGNLLKGVKTMRLQGQKQGGVKIAIQPYPYIKGESKGQNKSLVILEATTEEVHKFIVTAFKELDDKDE